MKTFILLILSILATTAYAFKLDIPPMRVPDFAPKNSNRIFEPGKQPAVCAGRYYRHKKSYSKRCQKSISGDFCHRRIDKNCICRYICVRCGKTMK